AAAANPSVSVRTITRRSSTSARARCASCGRRWHVSGRSSGTGKDVRRPAARARAVWTRRWPKVLRPMEQKPQEIDVDRPGRPKLNERKPSHSGLWASSPAVPTVSWTV
ncbi:MAG: hypothetical protein NUV51_04480, partial [Sulfuricaulis sp.]|nr:hypothetical protein [Sulfuricaulis sp.]